MDIITKQMGLSQSVVGQQPKDHNKRTLACQGRQG